MSDFHVHVHHHGGDGCTETECLLRAIHEQGEKIMSTQQELVKGLNDLNDKVKKIGTETTTLIAKVEELKKVITDNPVPPEVMTAFDAVAKQAGIVDDLVPDVPPTPVTPPA